MKSLYFITASAIIFSIAGCSNENNPDTEPDTLLLKKHSIFSTSGTPALLASHEIEYDNAGRVSAILETDAAQTENLLFSYSGSGSNPVMATYGSTTHYFTFNANGNPEIDSSRFNDAGTIFITIQSYEYPSGNSIVVTRNSYPEGIPDFNYSTDSLRTDNNGNITEGKIYTEDPAGNLYLSQKYSRTFDDKLNPFSGLNVARLLTYGFENIYFYENRGRFFGKNNCITEVSEGFDENGLSLGSNTWTSNCTYNQRNYLIENITSNTSLPSGFRYVSTYQ